MLQSVSLAGQNIMAWMKMESFVVVEYNDSQQSAAALMTKCFPSLVLWWEISCRDLRKPLCPQLVLLKTKASFPISIYCAATEYVVEYLNWHYWFRLSKPSTMTPCYPLEKSKMQNCHWWCMCSSKINLWCMYTLQYQRNWVIPETLLLFYMHYHPGQSFSFQKTLPPDP